MGRDELKEHGGLQLKYKDLVWEKEELVKKHKDLVRQLRDKVECPVCYDVPKAAPIPVCPNGHVVCTKCVKEMCPTCRVKMGQGKSTLAVTVIENLDHECDNEGCTEKIPFGELSTHGKHCIYRPVECPGFLCDEKISLLSLPAHMVSCCLRGGEIKPYKMPHVTIYKTTLKDGKLEEEITWKHSAITLDERMFVVKVAKCNVDGNGRRWVFMVQMVDGEEKVARYGVTIIVHSPEEDPEGKYSQRYRGDICPIDVNTVQAADEKGMCLTLTDGQIKRFLTNAEHSEEKSFSVSVYLHKQT